MSLTHEEYIVDVLTLLALNATASATATSLFDSDAVVVHDGRDGDDGVSVGLADDMALSGGGGGGNPNDGAFVVVALSNQSIIASTQTTTAMTTMAVTSTTTMASAINPFASSIGAFITSPTLAAAANMTTTAATAAATTATTTVGKIRFNADIWLIPCYSIILLFAVVGNVLVITTLVQNRRMRTITNVFLLNLAISDILLGVLCMPVTLVGTLLRHFIFGEVLCKLFQFSQAASVAVSSWTLVAISCERYYAICHPLRSRTWQTLSHAYKIIAFIWLGSVLCMTPIALFSQLMPTSRQGMRKCREQWPRDALAYERSYNIFLDLVLLILPLMVLCAAYILITRTLYVSMQNERAINFGNSGSSPAITATNAATMYNHAIHGSGNSGNSSNSSSKYHQAMLEPTFTTTTTSTMAMATPSTSSSSTSNGMSHTTSNFSLTFRWNYRGASGTTITGNGTSTGTGIANTNGANSNGKTSSGILVNGGCMGRCRGDCCRISDELQSHANCTNNKQQQQQQFYYYDDLSSRSVGFGGIAHKRKQLTTPHNQHHNHNYYNSNASHQRHQRHLYGARRSASIKSLNRCSNDNCYYRAPHNDEHYAGAANGCGCVGAGAVYHMTAAAATPATPTASTTAAAAGATPTTSLATASASALALATSTGVTTALTPSAVAATTIAANAHTHTHTHAHAHAHAYAHNSQTMIVTNLTAQQPQRYKLYTQRQQATLLDGERYKMVTTTPTGMRTMDTTLRRTNTTKNLESKRRVVKMMFVLVLEFFICWTPLYVINTVAMFIGPAIYEYVDYTSISFFQLLAYSSSCCNPITYCFMNASFRRAFLDTFRGGLQWRRGRFKRHRRSKTETSLSAAGNSITLANSGATMMTSNTLLDSPRL